MNIQPDKSFITSNYQSLSQKENLQIWFWKCILHSIFAHTRPHTELIDTLTYIFWHQSIVFGNTCLIRYPQGTHNTQIDRQNWGMLHFSIPISSNKCHCHGMLDRQKLKLKVFVPMLHVFCCHHFDNMYLNLNLKLKIWKLHKFIK